MATVAFNLIVCPCQPQSEESQIGNRHGLSDGVISQFQNCTCTAPSLEYNFMFQQLTKKKNAVGCHIGFIYGLQKGLRIVYCHAISSKGYHTEEARRILIVAKCNFTWPSQVSRKKQETCAVARTNGQCCSRFDCVPMSTSV